MRKPLYLVLALSLVACQTTSPHLSAPQNKPAFGVKQAEAPGAQAQAPDKAVLSSVQTELIRKPMLQERLSFSADPSVGSPSATQTRAFVPDKGFKRSYILNLSRENQRGLQDLTVQVNGKTIFEGREGGADIADISLPIETLPTEENRIELVSHDGASHDVQLEVIGFIKPEDIPRAVHSRIPMDAQVRQLPYKPGRVGIKFLEGMKVRLANREDASSLKDLAGLSLTTLQQFMKKHKVKAVRQALGADAERWDREEAKAEELLETDVANLNLFYYLEAGPEVDVWALVDELRQLPFIEEAYPEFEPQSATPYTPTDPRFNTSDDQWQRVTHILQNRSSDPGPDDDGAWSYTHGGKSEVKVAVIDYGAQVGSTGAHISLTHDDLGNVIGIKNVDVPNSPAGNYTNLGHGTGSAAVIGATANNSHGLAGAAFGATTYAIHAFANSVPSLCLGTGFSGCDAGADAIILARKYGARAIAMEAWFPPNTVEQIVPTVRAAIATTVAHGTSVFVPAGNDGNIDIRWLSPGVPMPDTGSVLVGGLNLAGTSRQGGNYNYGISTAGGANNLYTSGGHGVDVSGPAERIFTAAFDNASPSSTSEYGDFSGTSGATPIVTGVAALMLSVKPDLTPLEIRKTLRETRVDTNTDISTMPGMVNAYAAVGKYAPGGSSSSTTAGLYGKYYASTIFPPEPVLNSLSNSASLQENFVPYYTNTLSTVNHTGSPNAFGAGLTYNYMADIQGIITAPSTGSYTFWLYHDDTVTLEIDGQIVILTTNRGDANYGYSSGSIYLSAGAHNIQILRAQERSNADTALWWSGPSIGTQIVPSSALSHSTAIETSYQNTPQPNVVGRFFKVPSYTSPANPLPIEPSDVNTLPYIGNKLYSFVNYTGGSSGDVFGIGHTDNFQGYFSGFLKLPAGYSTGTYTLRIGHDDGMIFDLEGQRKITQPNQTGYVIHSTTHYLQAGVYYPFSVHYHESGGGADLSFMWQRPGFGTDEVIPASALFH